MKVWVTLMTLALSMYLVAGPTRAATDEAGADQEAAESGPVSIDVDGDRVTGTFTAVNPTTAVHGLAYAFGATVVGGTEATEPVTLSLDDVPVDRALERILRGQSFTVVYTGEGKVRRIRLHGAPQEAPVAPASLAGDAKKTAAATAVRPHELFGVEVEIPKVGPLAEHFGSDTATLGQLYEVATDQDQASLRIAAVDAGMAAIEADTGLQDTVDSFLEASDDQSITGLVRMSAGTRANELVSRILSRTRRPAVRQRAITILRQLRQPAE